MQKQRIARVLCPQLPDNNKAMSQRMLQKCWILMKQQVKSMLMRLNIISGLKHLVHPAHWDSDFQPCIMYIPVKTESFHLFESSSPTPEKNKTFFFHYQQALAPRAELKMLRKLICTATRFSKVAGSRWVGRSPSSCCFIPSRPKNSNRESGEPEAVQIDRI